MTPSDLKSALEDAGNLQFFDCKTMRFFGDTMRNYGVRQATVDNQPCWELYRRRPVKMGLQKSTYFHRRTFKRIHVKR